MQNQSALLSSSTPRQLQAVAALLPEEILDSIFEQLGYDCSMDVLEEDRAERGKVLSNMSVIAEGWTRPARRLLFRSVRIEDWTHLQEEVEQGVRKQVRELDIRGGGWYEATSQETAGAIFKLLKQLPNLRRLRLSDLRFDFFNPADSDFMQSTVLLPLLRDLHIFGSFPNSMIFDLLATSDHRISRLSIDFVQAPLVPLLAHQQLDFRGNLRLLSTETEFYRTLADPRWNVMEGLKGLEEFHLQSIAAGSGEGGEEDLYRVIAPTLSTLAIHSDDTSWFARYLPLLTGLSRLSIRAYWTDDNPDPAPLLRCLPPSLAFLQLQSDHEIEPSFARWIAAPSLVPAGLKQIQIDEIQQFQTYRQLPPIQTLGTTCRDSTLGFLRRLSPGTLPYKTLEMFFPDSYSVRRSLVEAECARLGVVFRQRPQYWAT